MFQQLNEHISLNGYSFKAEELVLDGQVQNLAHDNFKGWYIGTTGTTLKGTAYATLTYEDFRRGERYSVKTDPGKVSKEELSSIKESQRQAEATQKRDLGERQENVAERAREEIREFERSNAVSEYLEKKKLTEFRGTDGSLHGAIVIPDGTVIIPTKDIDGKVWGYQSIDNSGQKLFKDGQRTEGLFHRIGNLDPKGVVYICEGFATGASIYGASGKTTVVGFSSGKLLGVAKAFRNSYPSLRIVVCGDEDVWKLGRRGRPNHTGRNAARAAASAVHGSICQVSFRDLNADFVEKVRPTDFNDLHIHGGLGRVTKQLDMHYETAPWEYIATEHTGFHEEIWTKQGPRHESKPTDLRDYFERANPYVVMNESEGVYVYRRGVYKQAVGLDFGQYAQQHYEIDNEEVCTNFLAREFEGAVKRTNVRPVQWFTESIKGHTNFINGYLHIESGEFKEHTPKRAFRTMLPYKYDPKATSPHFDQFLKDITCNDEEMQLMLKEYMGYALSNDAPWLQTALFMIGTGANGKSTFLNVLKDLLGIENISTVNVTGLSNDYKRQTLDGKMANLSFESDKKGLLDSTAFKELVTGDPTTVRAPYEKPYTMESTAKFFIAVNDPPQTTDSSEGFWRRMLPAPFNARFSHELGNVDLQIGEKLSSELSGIYNRCIHSYMGMKKRGSITMPSVSKELVGQLRQDNDPVAQFIEECGLKPWDEVPVNGATPPSFGGKQPDGTPYVISGQVYSEYVSFSERNGFKAFNSVHFGRRAMDVLSRMQQGWSVTSRTVSRGGRKLRCWVGVDWRGGSDV